MNDEVFEVVDVSQGDMGQLRYVRGAVNFIGDPNSRVILNRVPLHFAAMNLNDNFVAVKALVNVGADVNAQDHRRNTPLHLAIMYHNRKITETLLECGADVNIPDRMGKTALHFASFSNPLYYDSPEYERDLSIVKSLLQNGASVNSFTSDHETPLIPAIKSSHLGIIKELLKWGADVHTRNNRFKTCLHIASVHPNDKIFMELLKHGACTECFDQDGKTALDIILGYRGIRIREAMQFISIAILVNKGKWTEFYLSEENDRLRTYIPLCVEEVNRMRTIQCDDNISLWDFVLRDDSEDDNWVAERSIFDRALEEHKNFRIYNDIIKDHFRRSYLVEKMSEMNICATGETGVVFLNYNVIRFICSFLSDEDLLNFLRAFI